MNLLLSKFTGIFIRLQDWVKLLPIRALRLFAHLVDGIQKLIFQNYRQTTPTKFLFSNVYWWIELFFLLLDISGFGEIYETLCDWIKFNTRPLKPWEKEIAREVFGDTINYKRVRVDEWAFIGPPQLKICYVSGYIINSWGKMRNSTLIHEMAHIWHYEKIGLTYIPRALGAQHTMTGYDYGGLEKLKQSVQQNKTFFSFNLEQQAEIVADYYNIKNGYPAQWTKAKFSDLPVYEYFVNQVRSTTA